MADPQVAAAAADASQANSQQIAIAAASQQQVGGVEQKQADLQQQQQQQQQPAAAAGGDLTLTTKFDPQIPAMVHQYKTLKGGDVYPEPTDAQVLDKLSKYHDGVHRGHKFVNARREQIQVELRSTVGDGPGFIFNTAATTRTASDAALVEHILAVMQERHGVGADWVRNVWKKIRGRRKSGAKSNATTTASTTASTTAAAAAATPKAKGSNEEMKEQPLVAAAAGAAAAAVLPLAPKPKTSLLAVAKDIGVDVTKVEASHKIVADAQQIAANAMLEWGKTQLAVAKARSNPSTSIGDLAELEKAERDAAQAVQHASMAVAEAMQTAEQQLATKSPSKSSAAAGISHRAMSISPAVSSGRRSSSSRSPASRDRASSAGSEGEEEEEESINANAAQVKSSSSGTRITAPQGQLVPTKSSLNELLDSTSDNSQKETQ